jgi:hypothetical protein
MDGSVTIAITKELTIFMNILPWKSGLESTTPEAASAPLCENPQHPEIPIPRWILSPLVFSVDKRM